MGKIRTLFKSTLTGLSNSLSASFAFAFKTSNESVMSSWRILTLSDSRSLIDSSRRAVATTLSPRLAAAMTISRPRPALSEPSATETDPCLQTTHDEPVTSQTFCFCGDMVARAFRYAKQAEEWGDAAGLSRERHSRACWAVYIDRGLRVEGGGCLLPWRLLTAMVTTKYATYNTSNARSAIDQQAAASMIDQIWADGGRHAHYARRRTQQRLDQ